jgi:hypothetical protein
MSPYLTELEMVGGVRTEGKDGPAAPEGVYKEGNIYIYVRLATDQATEFEKTKPLLFKQGN